MARPKSFDVDKVLDAALECFWREGMKAASIRDLADEMGIAGPSLYNTFGCKRDLFAQVLERYAVGVMRVNLARMEADHAPKAAIHVFFVELIEKLTKETTPNGCLILKAAMELDTDDPEMGELVSGYLDEISAFFKRNLIAAQAQTALPAHIDPDDTAELLLSVTLGLNGLAHGGYGRDRLEAALRPVSVLLDDPKN